MSALILLVHADEKELRRLEQILSDEQYLVATATSFKAASKLLKSVIPDLLIVDTNLGEFSGILVATLIKRDHPHLPVLMTHRREDPVLEADVTERGFGFIGGLGDSPEFVRAVRHALGDLQSFEATIREWRRKPLSAIDVRVARPSARLVDVSYGGCRLLVSG